MNHSKGFTLIELMIVVIVIGVLATLAIPSYNEYHRKRDRAVAQQEMLKLAAELDRYRSKQFSYKGFEAKYFYEDSSGNPLPVYKQATATVEVPLDGSNVKYTIKITDQNGLLLSSDVDEVNGFGWRITAIRKDETKQALNYDLYLNSDGVRCMTRTTGAVSNKKNGCGADSEVW